MIRRRSLITAAAAIAAYGALPAEALIGTRRALLASCGPAAGSTALLAMPKWAIAAAAVKAGSGNAKLVCLGDSTTAGVGSNGALFVGARSPSSYPLRLAGLLPGGANNSFMGNQFVGTNAVWSTYNPQIVCGAGWAPDVSNNSLGANMNVNSTTTSSIDWTPSVPFDTMEVWTPRNTTLGTITVGVDAGAALATIVEAGSAGYIKTIVSCTFGTHTINFNRVSGPAYIAGCKVYTAATSEISVYNCGWSGGQAQGASLNGVPYLTRAALGILAPDLTIIDLGINDWTAGTLLSSWIGFMQSIITTALISGDVILMSPNPTDPATTPIATQAPYIAATAALAATNGCNYISLTARWKSYAAATAAGLTFDAKHPNAFGYADIVSALANIILNAPAS